MQTIVVAAAGSGGHLIPALAVARELHARANHRVCWVGSKRMQNNILQRESFAIYTTLLKPLRGGGMVRKLSYIASLPVVLLQTFIILLRVRARAVFSTGGYAVLPAALSARLLGLPLFLQEQNARLSLGNRLFIRWARRIYTAYPQKDDLAAMRPKVRCFGNPIANMKMLRAQPPKERYGQRRGALRLFVTGGSQGALALNDLVPVSVGASWNIRHQCGPGWLAHTSANYRRAGLEAQVDEFIQDMAAVYQWADLVVARAGAMTLQDIMTLGVAAILIPFPHAADNHQKLNARYLAGRGAAFLIQQADAGRALKRFFSSLEKESPDDRRNRLAAMAERAYRLRTPYAARAIVDDLLEELQCA